MKIFYFIKGKQDYFMEKRGVVISVHNSSHTPLVKNEGIKVPVGFLADISVDRTFYVRLPSPFSDCRKDTTTKLSTDSNYYNKTVDAADYSKSLCDDICLQNEFIVPQCNCNDPELEVTD
ncbi:Degenerin deg-1, partial [Brachionus plicatilis]